MLLYEIAVRVHFESRLFAVCFDEDLVVPLTIGIVFPDYLYDLSAYRLSLIVLWTDAGSDFRSTFSPGCFPG